MGDKKLGDTFGFSEADLELNRAGQLAPSQEKLIRRRATFFLTISVAFSITILPLLLPVALAAFNSFNLGALVFVMGCVALGLFGVATGRNARRDLRARHVVRMVDRIQLGVEDKRRAWLKVQGKRFRITANQLLALRNGQYYAVYVAPASRILVAMEPVDMTEEADTDAAIDVSRLAESEESITLTDDGEIAQKAKR